MTLLQQPGANMSRQGAPVMVYQDFPKWMSHPGYAPAKVAQEIPVIGPTGKPTGSQFVGGTSERFPPVLVHSPDQEQYHQAQGYRTNGSCSASEFDRLVKAGLPKDAEHQPQEYPKWVKGKLCQDAIEEAKVLGSLPEPDVQVAVPAMSEATPPVESLSERKARLRAELAALEAEEQSRTIAPLTEEQAALKAARSREKSAAIKAGLARKRLEAAQKMASGSVPEEDAPKIH